MKLNKRKPIALVVAGLAGLLVILLGIASVRAAGAAAAISRVKTFSMTSPYYAPEHELAVNNWLASQRGLKVDRVDFLAQQSSSSGQPEGVSIWYHISGSRQTSLRYRLLLVSSASVDEADDQTNTFLASVAEVVALAQIRGYVGVSYDLAILYEP